MKVVSTLLLLLMLASTSSAQVFQSGDITDHIDSIISVMPGATPEGLYLQPGTSSRSLWRSIIQAIMLGDYHAADTLGDAIEYQVVEFTDTSAAPDKVYYILERETTSTSRYWGTYVFNPDAARPTLAIQCPHPLHDLKTGNQGFHVFRRAGARAYFVAGIHRCNGATASPCDGTTTACSETAQAYRYSDQAHVVLSTFQITTEELLAYIPELIVIQPHGYSQGAGDPDIIMSNGTRFTPTPTDWLLELRDNLLLQDNSLTFKIAHVDLDWDELIARNNCQGRLINNGSDPCGTNATETTGRFLHLEQKYTGLRDNEANWNKLANAVIATFPPVSEFATAQSGSWTDPFTWQGGSVPNELDDVIIASGHTVSVDDTLAQCRSLSFAGTDALIDLNADSRLTIYGNMTLFSESHNVFSAGWSATNAKVRLAGADTQTLSGWSTTGASTSFRDLVIDKDSGSVVTTSGVGMRLCVQNSLEIVSGQLVLASDDDFEGRWASSGNFLNSASPTVTIHPNGSFSLVDGSGTHFIRSGLNSAQIGKFTIQGLAEFTDASSYDISIAGFDILAGGQLTLSTGLGSTTYGPEFNPGTITIDSGGVLFMETTSELWFDTSVVVLSRGGILKTSSSTTPWPPTIINDGRVRYQRNPSTATTDQVVVDTDYWDIEFSFNGNGTRKLWELTGSRTVSDSLEVNNSAEVIITSAGANTLTVDSTLRLTSGSLDISDPNLTFLLADGSLISRATGTISSQPTFAGVVDVRYTSSTSSVSTGPELPTDPSVLRDLTVFSPDQTVTLSDNVTVNDELTLSTGTFDNDGTSDDKVLSLSGTAIIRRATGQLTAAPAFGSSVDVEYISTVDAVMTGPELPTATTVLNDLRILGDKGVTLSTNVTVNGELHLADSILSTASFVVTLSPTATLTEDSVWAVQGRVQTTRSVGQSVAEVFGELGIDLTADGATPGSTQAIRVTGESQQVGGGNSVLRRFQISPTINSGLDATLVFRYKENELNGLNESELVLYQSIDAGSNWTALMSTVDEANNVVTTSGLDRLGWFTLGAADGGCCVGRRGDLDGEGDPSQPTLGDLTVLIDHLFISLTPLTCWEEGNMDESQPEGPGSVTLGDLTIIIDALFVSLSPTPFCP